jgi:hypothetical protein
MELQFKKWNNQSEWIVAIIKQATRRVNPFGGNCGVFANAMCRYLTEKGLSCELALVGNSEDWNFDEQDLHHVVFSVNGIYYDGSGMIGNAQQFQAYANDFSEKYYNDPQPYLHAGPFNVTWARNARINTDYSVSEDGLYANIKKIGESMLGNPKT